MREWGIGSVTGAIYNPPPAKNKAQAMRPTNTPEFGEKLAAAGRHARGWMADTATCTRFLSRLPVPVLGQWDDPAGLPDFTRVARAIPLAGLFIALPAALTILLLAQTALPTGVVAVLALAVLVATGGGLHEDGLSDVADGFFGAHDTARRLEIMKDSRVGAYGVLVLVFAGLLASVALAGLLQRHGAGPAALAVIAAAAFSRAVSLWPWNRLPNARTGGLADIAGAPETTAVRLALAVGLLVALPCGYSIGLLPLATAAALAALAALAMTQLARAKIGGCTGDVIGATQQLAFLAFLLGLLIFEP